MIKLATQAAIIAATMLAQNQVNRKILKASANEKITTGKAIGCVLATTAVSVGVIYASSAIAEGIVSKFATKAVDVVVDTVI